MSPQQAQPDKPGTAVGEAFAKALEESTETVAEAAQRLAQPFVDAFDAATADGLSKLAAKPVEFRSEQEWGCPHCGRGNAIPEISECKCGAVRHGNDAAK